MIFLILKDFLKLSIFISLSYSIDVYKYSNRNFESPAYSTTKLSLEKMGKVFTICSYHFQKQINENSVSIYTLHDSLNSADPLMFLGIWKPNKLWLFVNDKWFDLGAVPFFILQQVLKSTLLFDSLFLTQIFIEVKMSYYEAFRCLCSTLYESALIQWYRIIYQGTAQPSRQLCLCKKPFGNHILIAFTLKKRFFHILQSL